MSKLDWSKANLPNADPARVLDVEVGWLRDDFARVMRNKRKAKSKKKSKHVSVTLAPLVIPEPKVGLAATILHDLGMGLPAKRNKLNNRLKNLIADNFISETGEILIGHPLMVKWLAIMEARHEQQLRTPVTGAPQNSMPNQQR